MRKVIVAVVFGVGVAFAGFGGVHHAAAAPIDCPPGQSAEKVDDWWSCVNKPGHEDQSGDSKNPNGNPNFRR